MQTVNKHIILLSRLRKLGLSFDMFYSVELSSRVLILQGRFDADLASWLVEHDFTAEVGKDGYIRFVRGVIKVILT